MVLLSDILFGELWIAGGQSNMEFPNGEHPDYAIHRTDFLAAGIRAYQPKPFPIDDPMPRTPQLFDEGSWVTPDEDGFACVSALASIFAQHVSEKINVPVGFLNLNRGASRLETWLPERAMNDWLVAYLKQIGRFPTEENWNSFGEQKDFANKNFQQFSAYYNRAVAPLSGISARGVLWYQGESNCSEHCKYDSYPTLLELLRTRWQEDFGIPDHPFPFYVSTLFPPCVINHPTYLGYFNVSLAELEKRHPEAYHVVPNSDLSPAWAVHTKNHPVHPAHKYCLGERFAKMILAGYYKQGPDSADVYYTIDGAYPTAYSMRYTGPFVTTDKITVKAIARREGYRNSSMAQRNNWFSCDGATYRVTSSTEPFRVVVSEAPGGNDENDYCGHYVFGEVIQHDTATYAVEGFDVGAFRYATKLRSVTVENSSMRHIGDSLFHGCFSLNAVVWNSPCALPQAAFDEDSYRNLLLYLPDTVEAPASFSRNPYAAIVVDGRSGPLTLDAQSAFYCPHPFTADRVTYRRTFKQTTGIGASAGWETLVLPFDVQHIAHASKGSITPFGGEGTKHCWLATPQGGSFAETSEIRANVPYIISMPNNNAYGDQSIAGSITFSAENALIHATPLPAEDEPQAIAAAAGEMVTVNLLLKPTYDPVGVSDDVYVLNVGYKYAGHAQGSVFVSGKYDLPPFSVYMVVAGIEQPAPFYRIHIVSGEEREDGDAEDDSHVHTFTVTSRGGYLYIVSPEERTVQLYDSVGRWIRSVSCMAGTTVVGPLDEGLYIMERTKVYVER